VARAAGASVRVAPTPARLLRAVYGSTLLIRFGFGLTISVFADYLAGRSVALDAGSLGLLGFIGALSSVGEFGTVLISGALSDHLGRFPVLLSGVGVATVLLAAVSFDRSLPFVGSANFVFGVASGAILASSLAVVGDQADRNRRGYEMGWFDSMNLLGYVLGAATGLALLGILPNAQLGWAFRAGAVLLFAGFLFARVSVHRYREPGATDTFRLSRIRAAVLRREVLLVTLPWLVIYVLLGAAVYFLGRASVGIGLPLGYLAVLLGGGGLLLLLTQPSFGRLADRFGRVRMMIVGTVGFVIVLTFGALLASEGSHPVLIAGLAAGALLALSYGPAALAALADVSGIVTRGTTMAVYSLTISLGTVVGLIGSTQLYGRYGTFGLDVFFAGIAASLVILTLLRWNDLRTGRASAADRSPPSGRDPVVRAAYDSGSTRR
jgi:MFS family permease